MEKVNRLGTRVLNTMVIGMRVKCKEEASSSILMVRSMMENLWLIKQMAMDSLLERMVRSTWDIGSMINLMARVAKFLRMVQNTLVNSRMEPNMVKECISGLINQAIKDTGRITLSMVMESTSGQTVESMLVHG